MTTLTKKHFKAIAEIIKSSRNFPIEIRATNKPIITNIDLLVNSLSNYFKTLNENFDEQKFKKACLK